MVVQKRRSNVSKVAQAALSFIDFRSQERVAKGLKDKSRDVITDFLVPDTDKIKPNDVEAGNPNRARVDPEKGHRYYDFDAPVEIDGKKYDALELQRKVTGPFMDLEKLEDFFSPDRWPEDLSEEEKARRADLYSKVFHPVKEWIWDFDVVYRLQQEGKISEKEVQNLMSIDISWSLNVKEAR